MGKIAEVAHGQDMNAPIVKCAPTASISDTVRFRGRGSVVISDFCSIEGEVLLDTGDAPGSQIFVGMRSKIKQGAVLRTYDGKIVVGSRVTIGEYSILSGHGGLEIGDAVIIAGHCYFTAADHTFSGEAPVRFQGETASGVRVGRGAWFGARCVVLDGINVGDGCVVGAGSIVTKNLSANMLCMGIPCREIKPRAEEIHGAW